MVDIEFPPELIAKIQDKARLGRVVVAVAGPPAAGKSTLSEHLAGRFAQDAIVVPMDGFHLDNEVLDRMGARDRKGAPHTFDVEGLRALLSKIRAGNTCTAPGFDRAADKTVPDQITIPRDQRIIILEGNYLLLDAPCWRDLQPFYDVTLGLDVSEAELEKRLFERWRHYGLGDDVAKSKAMGNDIPNARLVQQQSLPADFVMVEAQAPVAS